MANDTSIKCLGRHTKPDCEKIGVYRGLCQTCYVMTGKRIRQGATTWAELEAQGKALPGKEKRPLR